MTQLATRLGVNFELTSLLGSLCQTTENDLALLDKALTGLPESTFELLCVFWELLRELLPALLGLSELLVDLWVVDRRRELLHGLTEPDQLRSPMLTSLNLGGLFSFLLGPALLALSE